MYIKHYYNIFKLRHKNSCQEILSFISFIYSISPNFVSSDTVFFLTGQKNRLPPSLQSRVVFDFHVEQGWATQSY